MVKAAHWISWDFNPNFLGLSLGLFPPLHTSAMRESGSKAGLSSPGSCKAVSSPLLRRPLKLHSLLEEVAPFLTELNLVSCWSDFFELFPGFQVFQWQGYLKS